MFMLSVEGERMNQRKKTLKGSEFTGFLPLGVIGVAFTVISQRDALRRFLILNQI